MKDSDLQNLWKNYDPDSFANDFVLNRILARDNLEWPENVFALSHVCIPISPADRFYGRDSILGGINAKGEKKVLYIADDLARLRYNPFFDLITQRLEIF